MLLATASIGRKLLFSFIAMGMLVVTSTLIGVYGFSLVAKTERNVVNSALPAMFRARQVSELSNKVISSVQTMVSAQNEMERQESRRVLFEQLDELVAHIKLLNGDSFDPELVERLDDNIQRVVNNLALLCKTVERRLFHAKDIEERVKDLILIARELKQRTYTQVLNANTVTIANMTHVYDLLEQGDKARVYQTLDTVMEVDFDVAERLHELHLLAYRMLNKIREIDPRIDLIRIRQIQASFNTDLKIMQRRVRMVEDPTQLEQITHLLKELDQRKEIFSILEQKQENDLRSHDLLQENFLLFQALHNSVNQLVEDSSVETKNALDALTHTLDFARLLLKVISGIGLLGLVLIVWRVVYVSVIKRLGEYTHALLSVAEGNLAIDVKVEGEDELADMGQAIITTRNTAHALNIVAEREAQAKSELEEHKHRLEELVIERTSQLQYANARLNDEVVNHAKARAEAERASRAKSAFLATISHEIRTPMNGVLGTASLLVETGLNPIQMQYADIINRSGNNLLAILNDVLDYSKIEAGHLEIRCSNFDLRQMVADTYQLMHSRAMEKSLEFTYHIESDVYPFWKGDITRLSQILNNLVSNAIKFTDEGHVDIYVSLNPENDAELVFEVTDTGVGICKDEQHYLFNAFSQAESGKFTDSGTGLGLAISQKLVEAMGGQLYIDSEIDHGSRFWFVVKLEKGAILMQKSPEVLENKFIAKILLVEDNPINQLVAEGFLTRLGHQVVIVNDGATAESMVEMQEFDLMLLDINLPDCSGVELLHRLKRIEAKKQNKRNTPMVAVSAHVFNEEVEAYLSEGFDAFLPKPIEKHALTKLVQQSVDGQKLLLPQQEELWKVDAKVLDNSMLVDSRVILSDIEVLGSERVLAMIALFEKESQQALSELEEAESKADPAAIKNLIHKLKGSAGSLGLVRLMMLCQHIEESASPLNHYQTEHEELAQLVSQSIQELANIKLI